MIKIKSVILILTLGFVGCSSIRTDTANPSLQTPILTKSEQRGIHLELGSSDRIKFTDDASFRPPTINLVHSRSNDARANFAYGINDKLDIAFGLTSSAGLNLTSRVRFSGEEKSTWITAGTLFLSYDASSISGDQKGEFGPGGYNWQAKANSTLGAVGLAIGYRFSDEMLFIANAGIGQTRAEVEIKQDAANGDPGGKYDAEIKAPLQNLGFGVTFGQRTLTTLGMMYTHKEWKDSTLGDTSTTDAVLKIEMD